MPPAKGHHHEWVDDVTERTEAQLAGVENQEAANDSSFVQLREQPGMAAALRTSLEQVLSMELTLRSGADADYGRAVARYNYYHRIGREGIAHEYSILAAGYHAKWEQFSEAVYALQGVLEMPNEQLVAAANDHLAWLRDSTRSLSRRADAADVALDGTARTLRAFRVVEGYASAQGRCYTLVTEAINAVARQFGQ
jgi:hypothetical protein